MPKEVASGSVPQGDIVERIIYRLYRTSFWTALRGPDPMGDCEETWLRNPIFKWRRLKGRLKGGEDAD